MTPEALISYFDQRGNRFSNKKQVEMGILPEDNTFWSYCTLISEEEGPFAISILTERDSGWQFIDGFRLKSENDIEKLSYNNLWMRYLNSDAEIFVKEWKMDATLGFRIVNNKTIIYSLELHFYDVVQKHLTLPEDFVWYITNHESLLETAEAHRYKFKN